MVIVSKQIVKVFLFITLSCSQVSIGNEVVLGCGPSGILGKEFSSNVDSDSRCFEVRMYTAAPENSDGIGGIGSFINGLGSKKSLFLRGLGLK
jgi:hypothetical protein